MKKVSIDNGNDFDWGKTSKDYAAYRDIYPTSFYETLHALGIGRKGQNVLDLGTGTGVLPRNMYKYGAEYVGTDISFEQIEQAKFVAKKNSMNIDWLTCPAEEVNFNDNQFDVVSAVQCWQYFNKSIVIPKIKSILKPNGHLVIAFMSWLTEEDEITKKSHELVLKYNPKWKGYSYRTNINVPPWCEGNFQMSSFHSYDEYIPFTYDTWNGRMKACRGIGASLPKDLVEAFSKEHLEMLRNITSGNFCILHEIVIMKLRVIK